jgi:hypothetical protein
VNMRSDISRKRSNLLAAGLIDLLVIGWGLFTVYNGWKGYDWTHYFQPWTLAFLSGHTPYMSPSNLYPPWTFVLLAPLAILPTDVSRVILSLLCMGSFGYVAWRMGAKPLPLALLLISPQIAFLAVIGNIDWLVILGYLMPAPIGLFFVLIKPQIGIAVALFWLVEAWRTGGIIRVLKSFAPVTLAYILSVLIYGPFFLPHGGGYLGASWDANTWPVTIPVGLVLVALAIRRHDIRKAILASPLPTSGFIAGRPRRWGCCPVLSRPSRQ